MYKIYCRGRDMTLDGRDDTRLITRTWHANYSTFLTDIKQENTRTLSYNNKYWNFKKFKDSIQNLGFRKNDKVTGGFKNDNCATNEI